MRAAGGGVQMDTGDAVSPITLYFMTSSKSLCSLSTFPSSTSSEGSILASSPSTQPAGLDWLGEFDGYLTCFGGSLSSAHVWLSSSSSSSRVLIH